MKKAIVTGATGFIGSAFVQELTKRDIEVVALGRKDFRDLKLDRKKMLEQASYLKIDMRDIDSLQRELSQIDWEVGSECVFFNLAWGGRDGKLSDLYFDSQFDNVNWSITALETATKLGCKRFIQIGTMEELFAEKYLELNYKTDFYWNRHVIYSVAKIAARNSLKLKAHAAGIDFIYVNHSHVMGVGDEKDSFLQVTLQKIINGEELKVSSGEQYFDVVSLEDCVNGYLLVGLKGVSGSEYWVGSGEPQRLKDYLIRMCQLYPSKFGIQFGEIEYNDVIIDKEAFSINKLIEHTGYKPNMTFEQTIVKVYNSLISH